ncbi:MAG: glycosyltransferase family 2 protein [Candidatus Woesearchaeota archaeon]
MGKPLVSVIMPAYNASDFIEEAIDSILKQTYTNFEFIIIDDSSTDNTWEIINSYNDKRIKAYQNKENSGVVKTRNRGFDIAKGEYYAIFDSDDISMPNRLEEQVRFLEEHDDYGAVGSHIYIINEESNIIAKRKYITEYSKIKKNILWESPFAQPSVMIRKEVIDVVGYYKREGYDRARDYDLWIRIYDKYKIVNLDSFLLEYRVFSRQGKSTHLKETLKSTLQVKRKWLFKSNYINTLSILRYLAENILLLLPNKLILVVFKKMEYDEL